MFCADARAALCYPFPMFEWIVRMVNSLGYFGVAMLMFIEDIFPPVPSEIIMPLAGYTVTKGKLSLLGVILAGTAGSLLGSLPLYYIGRTIKRDRLNDWIDRHGRWLTISRQDMEKAQRGFDRHGGAAVFLCRLVPGVRSLIAIPAGIAKMNVCVFLAYTALGAGVWAAALGGAGYFLGSRFKEVDRFLGPASYVILGLVVAVYVVRVVRCRRAR